MECTLGNLEKTCFAEFQIASGAISNLQSRAHLREGTLATLNREQVTPVQFSVEEIGVIGLGRNWCRKFC